MTRRWKTVAAACVAATAMSSSAALAHDPEDLGTPLTSPFGERFSFISNDQTSKNQFGPNPYLTSSDMAFWGDMAFVGDYGGFRIFDVSQPRPRLISDVRCWGPQSDVSVFDRDGNGTADILVSSVDSPMSSPECGARPAPINRTTGEYPSTAWEGLRIFDISDPSAPKQIATVYQDCGSHTNTLLPTPDGKSMNILNSSYPLGPGPTCGPQGEREAGRAVNHGVVQVVNIPFDAPSQAKEITELRVVYPGDADGRYRPVTEQGLAAAPSPTLLDDFIGCHDLSVFPDLGMVGAACGEQAQVWEIDKATGLPKTTTPRWVYDQPNVDFWHSATFSWDGKVANFIDESFGDGCPATTIKENAATPEKGDKAEYKTGNMFFMDTQSGKLLSEYRNPRPTNDDLNGPDDSRTGEYCSSHLGLTVPSKDRYLLVNAFYRGGSSVIDFTNPTAPREIAFADLAGTNTWTAYPYIRKSGIGYAIPVYANDGLSRNYGSSTSPDYREASYGFMRLSSQIGKTNLVGADRLNPQLQERVIPTNLKADGRGGRGEGRPGKGPRAARTAKVRTFAKGKPVAKTRKNRTARAITK